MPAEACLTATLALFAGAGEDGVADPSLPSSVLKEFAEGGPAPGLGAPDSGGVPGHIPLARSPPNGGSSLKAGQKRSWSRSTMP
jgi:hypothetical protein